MIRQGAVVLWMSLAGAAYAADAPAPMPPQDQAAPPAAAAPAETRQPLLVVRFNQHRVYFERTLEQAVKKAREIKPNAMFELVSLEPANSGARNTERGEQNYRRNLSEVASAVERQGVSRSNISSRSEVGAPVQSQEVQIFVK